MNTRVLARPSGRVAAPQVRAMPRPMGWSPLFISLSGLLLTGIWRLQNHMSIIGTLRIPVLAAVAAYVLFFSNPTCRRDAMRLTRTQLLQLIGLFLLWMLLSVPDAINPAKAFAFIRKDHVKNLVLLVMIAASVRRSIDVERLLGVLVAGCVIYSAFVLDGARLSATGRLVMMGYYDANDYAFVSVITLPMIAYFLQPRFKSSIRAGALAALGVVILAMVRSGSRGGFLAILAVTLFITLRSKALPRRVRTGVLAAMALGLVVVGSSQYWSLMDTMLHPEDDYNMNSETGRKAIWLRGLGYMAHNPFVGVGVSNFENAEGTSERALARIRQGQGTRWTSPHNSFVEVAAEMGVPGFLLQILILVTAFRTLMRVERASRGPPSRAPPTVALAQALQGSLIGYCVAGFFLSQGFAAYLQVLFGLTLGIIKVAGVESGGHRAPAPRAARVGVRRQRRPLAAH